MEKLEKTKRNYELLVRDFFQVKLKEFNCIIAMVNDGDGKKNQNGVQFEMFKKCH